MQGKKSQTMAVRMPQYLPRWSLREKVEQALRARHG
jgi:hypothetical protein